MPSRRLDRQIVVHAIARSRPRPGIVIIAVLVLLSPAAVVYGASEMESLHHEEAIEQCATCHADRSFVGIDQAQGCTACHEDSRDGSIKTGLVISEDTRSNAESHTDGMNGPMYYEVSRIGGQPGPMVHIPAGDFLMGSDERLSDEGPQHKVFLADYYIDQYEVTNLQYERFIDATGRRSPEHFRNRTFPPGKVDHPVTFVSWHDGRDYCEWAGKRLPTEQEWEKAARGPDGRVFPWGDEFDIGRGNTPVRWAQLRQRGDTTPVGAFPSGASPYGIHDMSGNVWEWTASWYGPYPGNDSDSENFGEIYRVLKGGSWWDCSFYKCGISAPTFNRSFFNPRVKNATFGFRCAKDGDDGN